MCKHIIQLVNLLLYSFIFCVEKQKSQDCFISCYVPTKFEKVLFNYVNQGTDPKNVWYKFYYLVIGKCS